MNNVKIFVGVIAILILGVIATVILRAGPSSTVATPGQLDGFAQCLTDKGLIFYGAFWCPHCKAEKALFGTSARLLPYVECSLPDAQHQTQTCIDAKIMSYPTWRLKDGTDIPTEGYSGVSLATLATKSGCALPK